MEPPNEMVTISKGDMMNWLRKAAQEGLRIGKAGTEGEHTDTGIAYHIADEWLDEIEENDNGA